MKKLWMLAYANIRKTKSVSITLVVLFFVAAFLMNAGLLVVVNYGSFFDNLKKELSPTDFYFMMSGTLYTDEVKSFIENNDYITEFQEEDALWLGTQVLSEGKDKTLTVLFSDMSIQKELSKWKYVGEYLPPEEMSVYLPDIFKAVSGYELNDKITLKYTDEESNEDKTLTFTVKGYIEDIFFSSYDTGCVGFYLPPETYIKIQDILNDPVYQTHVVHANIDDVAYIPKIESSLREILDLNSSSLIAMDPNAAFYLIDLDLVELARCLMASMISVMMVIFAMVIVIVCLLVVRFRIVNSIEDDVMKIGSLKSIGYTSRQIRLSTIMQFTVLAGIGSLIGIILSYPFIPVISTVFEQQSGLRWVQGFDGGINAVTFTLIILIIIMVGIIASRRIGGLSPINALRGETTARKYKKNYLQLEYSKSNLPLSLAFKSILQNIKQNIMMIVILIAVTFTGAFGIIMFYNTSIDTRAFAEVPGFEICNSIAVLNPQMDHTDFIENISNIESVNKTQYIDEVKIKIQGDEVAAFVMDTYSKRESILVYEGRYPKSSKEITLAGILADRLHKKIGDTVVVQFGNKEENFTIVGLSNGSSMGGMNSSILTEDFIRLNENFKQQTLYIYLSKGTDAQQFVEYLKNNFDKELLIGAINFDKELADGMASYQNIVAAMGIVMLIITLFVVTLVLYFVINSSIIRVKRELGIQKAIGFTTFQLMNQLSVGFTVPIMIGSVIGSLLGAVYTNPMLSVSMKSMGVMRARFIVDPYWVLAFGAATIIFSYLLSLLITWRIRNISAYALVTE